MTKHQYRTTPDPTNKRMPGGIPYIIGNELAERFSFYGMKGILVVFMTKHLLDASGRPDVMDDEKALASYHLFTAGAYFFPIIGAMIADIFLGKYRTILFLSLMYCVGHALLAMMDMGTAMGTGMRPWMWGGLLFIAMGAGAIKPCVSAHVGDQFGTGNKHLLTQVFNWFYFSINLGAAASTLLTPVLLAKVGPWAAFGLPGVLMAIATFAFWLGRNKFIHVPPAGFEKFKKETFSPEGLQALKYLAPLFLIFVPMFWAIFDQTGGAWVLQADSMNRDFLGMTWLQSQIQAINPILILTLIPLFTYVGYPLMAKFFSPTPLRKIGIGLFVTALAFGISAMIETRISGGRVESVSSTSSLNVWSKPAIIDGPADGYGWASEQIDWSDSEKHPEIVIKLRERSAWTIDSVELNPYALAGPLAPVKKVIEGVDGYAEYLVYKDEKARRSGLTADERKALQDAPDSSAMAKTVTVFIHPPGEVEDVTTMDDDGISTTTTELVWNEVGVLELVPEDRRQRLSFDPVEATKVKFVINANGGDAIAKLGEARVLATGQGSDLAVRDNVWPDVAGAGYMPSIGWQFIAFLVITSAEIMVSIVCLEFAYTQSPPKMKSFIMGVYFLGVALGNIFISGVNHVLGLMKDAEGNTPLDGAIYYWAFAGLMLATFIVYVFFAKYLYKGKTYIQGEENSIAHAEASAEGTDPR